MARPTKRQLISLAALASVSFADDIRVRYDGADRVETTERGDLLIRIGSERFTEKAPTAYQLVDRESVPVSAAFTVGPDHLVTIARSNDDL